MKTTHFEWSIENKSFVSLMEALRKIEIEAQYAVKKILPAAGKLYTSHIIRLFDL